MVRPTLLVIDGGGATPSPWLNFRPTVVGRSPTNRQEPVIFRIALQDVQKALEARRRQPIFDLWSIVIGEPPPVPNVEWEGNAPYQEGLTCLAEAHACFRGIKRPIGEDDDGANVLVYVLRPSFHYVHEAHMVTLAHRRAVPRDVVFVCYVRLDVPFDPGSQMIKGVLTHWQFVEALGAGAELLPVDYQKRYVERLW
jgi:hypothetical protein